MNTNVNEELVAKLRERRVATQEALAALDGGVTPIQQQQVGSIPRPTAPRASRAHLTTELSRIEAALGRVDKGSFGLCGRCELDIELDRLMADPALPFCVECFEEVLEERRRQGYLVRQG